METLQVKTDIHCDNCVDKLTKHFDNEPSIIDWHVNLDHSEKTLTVKGNKISEEIVKRLLQKEGYKIIDDQSGLSFWKHTNTWKRASFNTLNCLIGCSVGDFGMIIFLQAYYPETAMIYQMILAIIAGLTTSIVLETVLLKYKEMFNWKLALKTAFGMSFISMVGMEIAMNTTDFIITGGKADFNNPMYWTALIIALISGFVAPLPYNYFKLQKFDKACH